MTHHISSTSFSSFSNEMSGDRRGEKCP